MEQFKVWNLRDDIQQYEAYIERCLKKTPYHLAEYLLAEEEAEESRTRIFLYEDKGEFALLPEVVRKINTLPYMQDLGETVSDMITPHEYGGIISSSYESAIKQKLIKNINNYCKENNIIFQFIRINPYLKGLPDIFIENGFEVIRSNFQVYVELEQTEEQIVNDYKPNVRRNVKRAEKEGLRFEIAEKSEQNIKNFQNMYQRAMEILEARRFLYFNDEYFRALVECECSRLALVRDKEGKEVAASIMLLGENIVYYHLGCFDREHALQRPMNYLIHSMILWSKSEGYKIFHLAGGSKSLMQFKTGYSSTRIDYYIANRICNKDKYRKICEEWKKQFPQYANENYYPLYRYNE